MKTLRLTLIVAAAAIAGYAPGASAFHSGGVAECEGCHSMHNSFEGQKNVTGSAAVGQSGPYLLKAQEQSGACLNCHNSADSTPSSYHISTDGSKVVPFGPGVQGPIEMTPGGDFAWLKTTRTGAIRGSPVTWDGDRQGHNIISSDYGYTQDKLQTVAPGGTYPAANLACSSCHDPHGRWRRDSNGVVGTPDGKASGSGAPTGGTVALPIFNSGSYGSSLDPVPSKGAVGVYRLLAGVGYQPKSLTGSFGFVADAPVAVAPSTYNRSEATGQTHVAYGKGMSEWCANCHTAMHRDTYTSGTKGLSHPAGANAKLTTAIAANYNAWVSSGVLSNTDPTKAYSTLAPFELGTTDYATLKGLAINTDTKDQSAVANVSNVACVSCHRAHASAFESATRFYTGNEFMTIADAAGAAAYDASTTENKINTTYTVAQQTNAYYGRTADKFGPWARNYCNKCHAKD